MAASADIDVFVELIGGADGAAYEAVEAALARGLPVVTANKAMLAAHGLHLANLSESHKAPLYYEAAVGGGIPVVKTLRESLAGNTIQRVAGILNGTCNYILSRMETEKLTFDVCLAEAQRLGYAEADPTFDIGGFDTAHKLAILASLAFGSKIDAAAVSVEGIESITLADLAAADELGFRIKLLGVAERTPHGIEQRVHPTMVSKSAPLAQTMGVLNAVSIEGDAVGELTLVGPGAGGDATASAVASDIADIARGTRLPTFGRPAATLVEADRVPMQRHEGGYYVRLAVADRPGAMGAIAARFGERMISLEAIMQKRAPKEAAASGVVPVVLMTHGTTEASIRDALAHAVEDGVVHEKPQVIRIEREAF
jgi:homoserine dehydrogenase